MSEPIRVLHAVVNMNRGGAETLIMNLYRNIDRTKVQFDFLTCKEGVFDDEIRSLGGRVHRIPYITDAGHFGYTKALNAFFASHPEYDIVHSHMDKMSGLVLRAAKKAGVQTRIAHSHNTQSEGGLAGKGYKWFAGTFIASAATRKLACSEAAAKWMFRDSSNAIVVKNGIECDTFAFSPDVRINVRKELGLSSGTYVLGHVGRFCEQKNHAFLLKAFAELIKVRPNAILLLAGDGPLRTEMEKLVSDLKIEGQVRFLGVRSDINHLLQAFDVFVFPSLHEGLPVTLVEAQGAGLPCLIADTITTEVDMGVGLVEYIPIQSPNAWTERLLKKQVNVTRGETAEALAAKGYDIRDTAAWITDFYLVNAR